MDYWLENVFSDETCKEFYDDYWIFGEGDASGDGNTEEYDEATDEGSGSGSGDEGKNLKVKRWKIDNFMLTAHFIAESFLPFFWLFVLF